VCTTEIIAFAKADTYFKQRNACLIGLSVDSNSSHLAWLYNIYCKTGVRVPFPIIADGNGMIARKYGMISSSVNNVETVRNVFIIDPDGKIRTILVYPMTTGRCIPEILRIIDALQIADRYNVATPANWVMGNPVIIPSPKTWCELEERVEQINKENNGIDWYLSFKDVPTLSETKKQENANKNIENKENMMNSQGFQKMKM
jgi:peroxiredoxin (alkyl hydroperoxide reductase subunit C)